MEHWVDLISTKPDIFPILYFQHFDDGRLQFGSLPKALRKVMAEKFADFDEYQLAKYNKTSKKKKKPNIVKDADRNSTGSKKVRN